MHTTSPKKILITGVSGLLGSNLAFAWKDRHDVYGLYSRHPVVMEGVKVLQVDITDQEQLHKAVDNIKPEVIVHCAALADVDACEDQRELATLINEQGTRNLVESINGHKSKLVYISTDAVYDGIKGDFTEDNPVRPSNYYASTKHDGEKVALTYPGAVVIRTAFFGWNILEKQNFAEKIIERLSARETIPGWRDIYTSMVYTFDFARILEKMIDKDVAGVFNCASSDSISKYDFAVDIARRLNLDNSLIQAVTSENIQTRAVRAKRLNLNAAKLTKALGESLPKISEGVERFTRDFKDGLPLKIKTGQSHLAGYPEVDFIPYGRQSIDEDDINAVVNVLKSSNLTQGQKISEFEKSLCHVTRAKEAVAVNSGTSALHIACLAAGVSNGDEVITSPNSFVASANCAVYCGAVPVFADIDEKTFNISPEEISKKITSKTKALIVVHFAGQSCDMEAIREVVEKKQKEFKHKIFIIEDASHALGSLYREDPVGSCLYSDMSTMSFHPVKHVTTGEGGAVLTNQADLARKSQFFRSHGITNRAEEIQYKDQGTEDGQSNLWYYEQQQLGFNYRITDIQCALGISQLKKLGQFTKRRREIVVQYNRAFMGLKNVRIPAEDKLCQSNFHLYVLRFDFKAMRKTRSQLMEELISKGIRTQVHYIPIHTQPYYQLKFGTKWGDCPKAEQYYQQCLSIPLYPAMTNEDVDRVVIAIKDAVL